MKLFFPPMAAFEFDRRGKWEVAGELGSNASMGKLEDQP